MRSPPFHGNRTDGVGVGSEAGQRTVANEDLVPTIIPESDDYTFTLQGFHVYGTNATYGQNVRPPSPVIARR